MALPQVLPKELTTEEEYKEALKEIENFMEREEEDLTEEEGKRLDELTDLVINYEEIHYPID